MFRKNRLEALSDGIFAIAMTLLVLDLKVPDGPLPPHFARLLTEEWMGVIITFVIAAIYWTLQHRLFELIPDVHERAIVPTFLFLGLISVLPFSTGYFSHHVGQRSAFVLYFSHAFLIGAALLLKLQVLSHFRQHTDDLGAAKLRLRLGTMCVTMGTLAIGSAFIPTRMLSVTLAAAALIARIYQGAQKKALMKKYAAHEHFAGQ